MTVSAAEGAIRDGVSTIETAQNALNTDIKRVESDMLAIGSQWQGNAAVAFQQLMVRWNEQARKVTGALDQFKENLTSAQRDYDTTDDTHSSDFGNLAGRLDG